MPNLDRYRATPAKGSMKDIAERKNISVSEAMLSAEAIVMVDTSGSMDVDLGNQYDWTDKSNTRWAKAKQALDKLQEKFDGRIIVMCFETFAEWCLDGNMTKPGGGTNLVDALEKAKEFDDTGMRFIIISDGEPDDVEGAVRVANTFVDPIDTIYIGPDQGRGAAVLARLTTGTAMDKVDPSLLEAKVTLLLNG